MERYIYICIIAISLFSCDSSIKVFEDDSLPISCEKIDTDFLIALNIGLEIQDSVLILNDFRLDPMVTALNLNNNTTISAFLNMGKGPNECIPPVELQKSKNSIYVLERQTSILYKFGISTIYDGNINLDKVWRSDCRVNTFIPLSDTIFLATTTGDENRFVLIDNKGEVIKHFGEYPDLMPNEKGKDDGSKSLFHQAFFIQKVGENQIAAIASHVLELYSYDDDLNFTLDRQVQLSEYEYSSINSGGMSSVTSSAKTARGSMNYYGTNKYIYVVYNPENEQLYMSPNKRNNEIWIFDWEGNPVKALLPDKDIYTIVVDNNNEMIYGVDIDSELYKISIANIW